MSYRQMIAPLRSDGSDFHRAPNHLGKLVTGLRCGLCGWLTQGVAMHAHRRREDGKGWEVIDSNGFMIFDPAPLISEEQAIALIKSVNVELKVPCQNCARYGGRVVSYKVAGGRVSQWECPHCLVHLGGKSHAASEST